MAANRKRGDEHKASDAETKLSRLLHTETALEQMLQEAKAEAVAIVEAAKEQAADLLRSLERELQEDDGGLKNKVTSERDRVINSIRSNAKEEASRLDELEEATIQETARRILTLLIAHDESGGSP